MAGPPAISDARLGLGDRYKLGCWAPLRLSVTGGSESLAVNSLAIAVDSDGVGAATTSPGGRPLATEPGSTSRDTLYVRVGKAGADLTTQLVVDGRVVDRRVFPTDQQWSGKATEIGKEFTPAVPATERLYLQLGGPATGTGGRMLLDLETRDDDSQTHAAYVADAGDLPRDAVGYDSFDAILLLAAERTAPWLDDLLPGDPRLAALVDWVESGGRLIVSCGAGGDALLGPGGAMAAFVPGDYAGPGELANAGALERFADAPEDAGGVPLASRPLPISRLENVEGEIEAFGGSNARETPLIVRTPRGFGEVTFVAFDLDAPAIAAWGGRTPLLRRLLEIPPESNGSGNQPVYGFGPNQDFVNRLIERLDTAFTGVKTAPFLLIVGLVLLYLLLIGPGDYFFVKNVLKRVEATWVTFPLLVLATSAAAYAGAYWLKGDKLRINQVEFIDVDCESGRTRGTLLTHLFSPRATRYDLELSPRSLDDQTLAVEANQTAWLGKPGFGLGGMQSASNTQGGPSMGYRIDPTPGLSGTAGGPTVEGLPVQVWSTKTLLSRYRGEAQRLLDAQLVPDRDGLVEGLLTNDTGARLADCRLLFGAWAWRLGTLGDGETATIDPSVKPIKVTTLLRQSGTGVGTESTRYDNAGQSSVEALSEALAIGARSGASGGPASRYLGLLDLTHRLDAGDALLLCRLEDGPRSELTSNGEPLIDPDDPREAANRNSWVFARFILPVNEDSR